MDLKKFFQIVLLSFYSPALYIEISQKWRYWGFNYLLKLSILITFVSSIALSILIISFNVDNPVIISLLSKIPELKIEKNIAHFVDDSLKSPIRIKAPNNSQDLIIVDLDIAEAKNYNQDAIIFTSDRLSFNLEGSSVEIFYKDLLNELNISVLNTENIIRIFNESKKKLYSAILFLGVPVGSLIFFVIMLLKATFYSSIAGVIMKIMNSRLDFKTLTRIAIVSLTPSVIISTTISLLFIQGIFNPIVQSIVSYIYMFYFISAASLCNKISKR